MKEIKLYSIDFERPALTYNAVMSLMETEEEIINRYARYLSSAEHELYKSFLHKRQYEFLAGRILAKITASRQFKIEDWRSIETLKGVFGNPLIHIPGYAHKGISISHKQNKFGIIIYDEAHPVGFDMEIIDNSKVTLLKSQSNKDEMMDREKMGCDESLFYTVLWSAKEALSKILRCGLTVPIELLSTQKNKYDVSHQVFEGEFCNFFQYRFVARIIEESIVTLVFPKRSVISFQATLSTAESILFF